jgi:hypothetical protein
VPAVRCPEDETGLLVGIIHGRGCIRRDFSRIGKLHFDHIITQTHLNMLHLAS